MQRKTRCLFVVFLLLANLVVYAQSITVTGKVVDSDGLEVIGANVTLKGAPGVGEITDINGHYKLKSNNPFNDVLVFTFIGMDAQEAPVKGRSKIDVTLRASSVMLDEVVPIPLMEIQRNRALGLLNNPGY